MTTGETDKTDLDTGEADRLSENLARIEELSQRLVAAIAHKKHVDPREDLVPVCPNCHAMLHRVKPPMDVEDLKRRMDMI